MPVLIATNYYIILCLQFQRELRRILITLIDAAHKVLCMNPELDQLFQHTQGIKPDMLIVTSNNNLLFY